MQSKKSLPTVATMLAIFLLQFSAALAADEQPPQGG